MLIMRNPHEYGTQETREHADGSVTSCPWPVHCAFCGAGLDRWYYCARAPMCVWCNDRSGPVLAPAVWEMDPGRVSPEARRVWESWADASSEEDR